MATEPPTAAFPPPQRVILRHAEVMASAMGSTSRYRGGGAWFSYGLLLLLVLAVWIGHLAAFWLAQQLPFPAMFALGPWLPTVLPAILCLIAVKLAIDFEQRRANRAYLARLAAIDSPVEHEGTYEVTPDALVLTTERMVLAPRWHAINRLERGEHGWVLSADQLHFLVPFAAFLSPEEQRRLLASITERLTPDARSRSREAVEFAQGAPAGGIGPKTPSPEAQALESGAKGAGGGLSSSVPTASGWLTQEQAGWAAGVVYGKIAHSGIHRWAYPLTAAVAGLVLGGLAAGLLGLVLPAEVLSGYPRLVLLGGLLLLLLGGAFGLAHGHKRLGIVLDLAWRAGLDMRGVPEQVEAQWQLTDRGIAYRTARFTGEATYASVHQVLHEHAYWIIAADGLTLCIPNCAFALPSDMHTFMAALLARISEPARARSVVLDAPPATAS
ncbi:hypothetical protein ACWPM1_06760 [Tsuneonella sp. HG249]